MARLMNDLLATDKASAPNKTAQKRPLDSQVSREHRSRHLTFCSILADVGIEVEGRALLPPHEAVEALGEAGVVGHHGVEADAAGGIAAQGEQLGQGDPLRSELRALLLAAVAQGGLAGEDGGGAGGRVGGRGPNPTFGEDHPKVESHLLDFEGSIYGEAIEVDFISRLRDIRQFDSADRLTDQLKLDVGATRKLARQFSL